MYIRLKSQNLGENRPSLPQTLTGNIPKLPKFLSQ